jgi:elongation factor P hydroxylase
MKTTHDCQDLIAIFNDLFMDSENTILIGQGEEPLYLPSDKINPYSRIIFTRDYFSSALHEVAHWCMASDERRQQVDYGYWYFPEGRNEEQQLLFEKAEIKPQALECIFSQSVGLKFSVSQDNLATGYGNAAIFAKNVEEQALQYLALGLPARAELFRNKLIDFYSSF